MEKKYTKDQILDAITQHWIENFGSMQSEDDERDGYFVTGFVLAAIQKRLEPVVQVDTLVNYNTLLEAVKMAYEKHNMDSDDIGWLELEERLHDTLSEVMGDEKYVEWKSKKML